MELQSSLFSSEKSETIVRRSSQSRRMRLPSISDIATNVTFQQHKVSREERCATLGRHEGYRGCTIWFTGLSGAGKTTISFGLEKTLIQLGIPCYGLDGDNIRHGLCKNLGFKSDDRTENIRRVAEVAKLFADMGVITLASFISPFAADRAEARRIHESVYVSTPLNVCEARDPKELYKKARSGLLHRFTGIDSAYEPPENPDLVLNASSDNETDSVQSVLNFLYDEGIFPEKAMHQLCGQPVRELFVEDETEKAELIAAAAADDVPKVDLRPIDLQWLQVLAEGWASPLAGFMRERQYLQSLHHGQIFDLEKSFPAFNKIDTKFDKVDANMNVLTTNDDESSLSQDTDHEEFPLLEPINQSIPIVLAIGNAQKDALFMNDKDLARRMALVFGGKVVAILSNPEVFPHCKAERVLRQFGCGDARHPSVKAIMDSGDWLLGGDLKVLERITHDDGLDRYRKTPLELRKIFTDANCDAVFAFQLRNPIHNGHALLMRETRAQLLRRYRNPMLLLHPLGGWTKDNDVPLSVRIAQHEAVLKSGVLDAKWTVLAIFPSPMLYAGPTEVQWHARARLACGANVYVVGRDPAGIQHPETGDYLYEPTHGAKVLSMAPGLPNLEIIPFRVAAYDKTQKKMAFFDPSRKEDFQFISGTVMRKYAKDGQQPPDGFMVPEAWQVLASHYAKIAETNGQKRN